MKLCCIYWTLLLISFTSSCLLFLIVASENTNSHVHKIGEKEVISNVTISDNKKTDFDGIQNVLEQQLKAKLSEEIAKENSDSKEAEYKCLDISETIFYQDVENSSPNVFEKSLTQQPNLSQGISETGQAVVLTLVDTASAELQNLAEPHLPLSDVPSKSSTNLTLPLPRPLETDTLILSSASRLPRQPAIPTILLTVESLNETEDNIKAPLTEEKPLQQDNTNKITDTQFNEEIIKTSGEIQAPSSSSEFEDVGTREKIAASSNEETTSPGILDGMIETGHEDIPSFSEWAQKRLEEAEKKKTHPNASIQNPGGPGRSTGSLKVRSKNYASPDCGAKIVAVNPEARSARSVLVSTRDEYMLNTCTSRIWFVVELCEAIQAKKIELANFELFSSSPKDLSVFVSDRFPTRDWSLVGQFTAQDERDVQSFNLQPHLFGKFIKVELHSHYGSEHFCPISLFRAYGTSEFEVLETETEVKDTLDKERGNGGHSGDVDSDDNNNNNSKSNNNNNSDDEDDVNEDDEDYEIYNDDNEIFKNSDGNNDSSRNLFGSARDAVIRIVKKAAKVLVKTDNISSNNISEIQESIENNNNKSLFTNCMTLRYKILCNNCTNDSFERVYQLLSCRLSYIDAIIKQPFVNNSLNESELCKHYGFLINDKLSEKIPSRNYTQRSTFLSSIFSREYITAFCNVLAMRENKLLLNSSQEVGSSGDRINATSPVEISSSNNKVKIDPEVNSARQSSTSCSKDSEATACHSTTLPQGSKTSQQDSSIKPVSSSSSSSSSSNVGQKDPKKQITHDNIVSTTTTTTTTTSGSKIKPSKTLSKDDLKRDSSIPNLEPSKEPVEETVQAEIGTTPSPLINPATASLKLMDEPTIVGTPTEALMQPSQISSHSIIEKSEDSTSLDSSSKVDQTGASQKVDSAVKQEEKKEKLKNPDDVVNSQEQLSEDTLFSDLRELDNSDTLSQGTSNGPSTMSPPIASSTPQQKESVFLRLSNRIKALERNMSLSGQYLEELSKRYKKQVEEMQKSLERTTITMGEEFRKGEEREVKRIEEISALRGELLLLSESMQVLLYEHNSWSNKLSTFGQHIVFIFVEIVVLVLIVTYCRKSTDLADDKAKKNHQQHKEITRRRSAESAVGEYEKGECKKRRPSEIASKIAGSYRGLMIDERTESKKDRKRKRKKDSLMRLSSNVEARKEQGVVLARRSLSVDNPSCRNDYRQQKRPDSAPDCEWNWPEEEKNYDFEINGNSLDRIVIDELDGSNSTDLIIENVAHRIYSDSSKDFEDSSKNNSPRGLKILKSAGLHSPSFMKTALRSRSKRSEKSIESDSPSAKIKLDKWEWYSRNSGNQNIVNLNNSLDTSVKNSRNRETNGHHGVSEDSESSSTTPTHSKKGKKESGLRKMVRRFF